MNWGFGVLAYGIFCSLWVLGLGILYGMALQKRRYGVKRIQ